MRAPVISSLHEAHGQSRRRTGAGKCVSCPSAQMIINSPGLTFLIFVGVDTLGSTAITPPRVRAPQTHEYSPERLPFRRSDAAFWRSLLPVERLLSELQCRIECGSPYP